jgi:hypothetical protein
MVMRGVAMGHVVRDVPVPSAGGIAVAAISIATVAVIISVATIAVVVIVVGIECEKAMPPVMKAASVTQPMAKVSAAERAYMARAEAAEPASAKTSEMAKASTAKASSMAAAEAASAATPMAAAATAPHRPHPLHAPELRQGLQRERQSSGRSSSYAAWVYSFAFCCPL